MRYFQILPLFLTFGCFSKEEDTTDDTQNNDIQDSEGLYQGDCLDNEDNDNDGFIDCEDQGCWDKPACINQADIAVSVTELNFGSVSAGVQSSLSFSIENIGESTATISNISFSGNHPSAFYLEDNTENIVLEAGELEDIYVFFSPDQLGDIQAELIISSDDSEEPEITISLFGVGDGGQLEIYPSQIDFGAVDNFCQYNETMELYNSGTETLEIYDIQANASSISLFNASIPTSLFPQESMFFDLSYYPFEEENLNAEIVISSNSISENSTLPITAISSFHQYTQTWNKAPNSGADIIFLVDQSGSMDIYSTALAANFNTLINSLSQYSNDWQIMVVNDDNACTNSGILTSSTPNYQSLFETAIVSGGNQDGSGYTESLVTLAALAIENTDIGECNEGFLRNNSMLHIITISDEPEQGAPTISTLVNDIVMKKGGNIQNVRISSVYNPQDHIGRYIDAVTQTGGLIFDINNAYWSSATGLGELAEISFGSVGYQLDYVPYSQMEIEVWVNGSLSTDWVYNPNNNMITFNTTAPSDGDLVEISYPLGECLNVE